MEEERTMKGGWRTMRRDVADTDNKDNLGMRVGITCRITNNKKRSAGEWTTMRGIEGGIGDRGMDRGQ